METLNFIENLYSYSLFFVFYDGFKDKCNFLNQPIFVQLKTIRHEVAHYGAIVSFHNVVTFLMCSEQNFIVIVRGNAAKLKSYVVAFCSFKWTQVLSSQNYVPFPQYISYIMYTNLFFYHICTVSMRSIRKSVCLNVQFLQ